MNQRIFFFSQAFFLFVLTLQVGWTAAAPEDSPASDTFNVRLICTSSRAGELDTCGCQKLQLGGLDREAWLIEDFSKKEGPAILLDTGGVVNLSKRPQLETGRPYLLQGLRKIGFHAINVDRADERIMGDLLEKEFSTDTQTVLISASLFDAETSRPLYQPYRIVEWPLEGKAENPLRIGIIGLALEENFSAPPNLRIQSLKNSIKRPELRMKESIAAVRDVLAQLGDQCDLIIVMGNISPKMARQVGKIKKVDLVLTGQIVGWPSGATRVTRPKNGNAWEAQTGCYLGRYLTQVQITGRRSKGIENVQAKRIEVLSTGKTQAEVTEILDAYKKAVGANYRKSLKRQPGRVETMWVGARACRACHTEIYESWKKTLHAHALDTLLGEKQAENPECLKCHVVGFEVENGFRDFRYHRHLGGVQCENCHGAGYEHFRSQIRARQSAKRPNAPKVEVIQMKKEAPPSVCVTCHSPPNDIDFDYGRDVRFVNHQPLPEDGSEASATHSDHSGPMKEVLPKQK